MLEPNFDRIQFASVRAKVDPSFCALQRELDVAWYGDMDERGRSNRKTGAKAGVWGRKWRGVTITSEEQFNRLSSLLESHRLVELSRQNLADGNPYPTLNNHYLKKDDKVTTHDKAALHAVHIRRERLDGTDISEIVAGR